jgi:hypothetical protein
VCIFAPDRYGTVVAGLLDETRLCALVPDGPNGAVQDRLDALGVETLFGGRRIKDWDMANACLAGLWLYHDFLEESHSLSEAIHTQTGSYWHGIMHRREPDYSNSKYWFRRVAEHPVFEALRQAAARFAASCETLDESAAFLLSQPAWNPFAFVDLCEAAVAGQSPCENLCREIQQREWELLFDFCYHRAIGT